VGEPTSDNCRWRAHPAIAGAVTVAAFAIPVMCSVGAAALLRRALTTSAAREANGVRWVVILGASTIVFIGCERFTRRAFPLASLLRLPMAFPGPAPGRISLARRSWAPRDLSRRVADIGDDPAVAAEQLLVLASALSAHDRNARGHAQRVRALSELIAEKLRLPKDDRDRLRWAAVLHDVGKFTIHSDILGKSDALSNEEWEVMRGHPLEGERLTAPLASWLGDWANTIAEHHERFDGSGYPLGLAGHEISLGARIVAVADFYDAMTSLHSYHEPRTTKAAQLQLAAYAGTQFDPVVVRAFLALPSGRRHAVIPLVSIGPLLYGVLGTRPARLADGYGRLGACAVVAAASVVALGFGPGSVVSGTHPHLTAASQEVHRPGATSITPPTRTGGGDGHPVAGRGASSSAATPVGARAGKIPEIGTAGSRLTRTNDMVGPLPQGDPPPRAGANVSGSTTTVPAVSMPSIPTTTIAVRSPSGPTTTSTTDPPPPPIAPPTALTATSDCQALVLLPEVSLSWTASPTASVTGYVVLRGPSVDSLTYAGTVSGRTNTSYIDTSVSGLSSTYWYEVEAVAGGSSAVGDPISVTTPSLCISAGSPG
jgi:HD-GYP domain-containing protein (c-di-GMP phosphodiesterase class II)